MNVILGSGVVGCLARAILGSSWTVIPFKRSMYYSIRPLADNYIVYNNDVDDVISSYCLNNTKLIYKCPISYDGMLIYDNNKELKKSYLDRLYKNYNAYIPDLIRSTFTVYPLTAVDLLGKLQAGLQPDFNENITKYGHLKSIDLSSRIMTMENCQLSYDKIISTIPLNALCGYTNKTLDLQAHDICYYVIRTKSIDLEGAESCLIANDYNFFKVSKLKDDEYLFWCFDNIENPYLYFQQFIGCNIDIIESYRIVNAIPYNIPPSLNEFESNDIYCVGSNAQWDDHMDVSSCILRLKKLLKNM